MNKRRLIIGFTILEFCFGLILGQKVANPVIMLSFDGLNVNKLDEYMKKTPDSNFSKFIENGVRASYMQSSFPSLTFPNHWAIVTGVYPGYNGVVSNTIYDPSADLKVNLLVDAPTKGQERWWNRSDPIWIDAKKHGLRTGGYFWAGSDIQTRNPDFWLPFNSKTPFEERVDTIIKWQVEEKLDFICAYFNEPDASGHTNGPNSTEYMNGIAKEDAVVGYLMKKIADYNLTHVNIILVSDHGMASFKQAINVGSYLNLSEIDLNRTELNVISNIHPSSKADKKQLFDALSKIPNIDVYYKEEIPERFNYRASDRIAPIVAVAQEGYSLTASNFAYTNLGWHGYDPSLESMRAIFLAQGPAFRKKIVLDAFENVNVKPLICGLLKINCPNTNGTIYKFQNGLVDQSFFNSARLNAFDSISLALFVLLTAVFMQF